MRYIKTYEFFGLFKKKVPEPKLDVIGTVHDILLDFVDEGKLELLEQSKDFIHYNLTSNTDRWRDEVNETEKRLNVILNQWGIKHYYFQHSHLYVISDDLYNDIYRVFKGLRRAKVVGNSYQYLLVKDFSFYIYVNGEDMSVANNIVTYFREKYLITAGSLCDILEEIIPPMYKLGHYMRCRIMDHKIFKSIRFKYYQPEL